MRCMYREKRYVCGEYLEVDIFPVFAPQKSRGKKRKPTSEIQKKLNQRNSERKLIRLLNTNFSKKDIRLDLTYDDENLPATPEDAQKEMQNFLRRVKRLRKKMELPDLKYVAVTEVGEKKGRLHHHIVMSGGIDVSLLDEKWGRGYTTVKPLRFNESGIVGIAMYMIKNPILGKRWCASKNLSQPKESQRDGVVPHYRVKEFCEDCENNTRVYLEKLYDGYSLTECKPYYNSFNAGFYITILMQKKLCREKRGKRMII